MSYTHTTAEIAWGHLEKQVRDCSADYFRRHFRLIPPNRLEDVAIVLVAEFNRVREEGIMFTSEYEQLLQKMKILRDYFGELANTNSDLILTGNSDNALTIWLTKK